jgi:hypothetical protein
MKKTIAISVSLIFLVLLTARSQDDYQTTYNRLKSKIEQERNLPLPSSGVLETYLAWMKTKAEDRNKAKSLASKAGAEGNPYWERRFLELANLATESGESTKLDAMFKFMRSESRNNIPEGYAIACHAAGPNVGEKIYNTAIENGFISEDIRERARCLMRYASNDLEGRWLYASHDSFLGKYDSEGFQVLPSGDWSVSCLRRGEFTTVSQGDPLPGAERGMLMCKEVRDICEFYNLTPEYNDMTDLMVQFLTEKKVLCLRPPNEGHQWYRDLAEKYKLDKAIEHIDGFYAIIKGKVEKEENGIRKPVAGAEVEFEAPKDMQTWKTKTDQGGNYRIEGVLLHKNCSPFILTARGDGCYKQEDILGPLEDPDKNHVLEKNLLLECGNNGYAGWINITVSWDYADDGTTYIGSMTSSCRGVFKIIEEMKEMVYQPFHIYGPSKATGTWKINKDKYCSGDSDCPGLCNQEFGSGSYTPDMWQESTITTFDFPTEIKEVAKQFEQTGMENYYEIFLAGTINRVVTQTRNKGGDPCVWDLNQSDEKIPSINLRYKLTDPNHLKGSETWHSSHDHSSTDMSITDMPGFMDNKKGRFDPEEDGSDYTYTISWDLKALNPKK